MWDHITFSSHSVLTVITDNCKILEARRAISSQGGEEYNLASQGKLKVCRTHYSTENAMFSEGQISDSRNFSQADTEERRGATGVNGAGLQAPRSSLTTSIRYTQQQWFEAGNAPALHWNPLLTVRRPKPHLLPSISHPFSLGSWKGGHFGFRQLLPGSPSQGRVG